MAQPKPSNPRLPRSILWTMSDDERVKVADLLAATGLTNGLSLVRLAIAEAHSRRFGHAPPAAHQPPPVAGAAPTGTGT